MAPLRGLKQADLLVVAPFSLSRQVRSSVARQPGVTGTEPIEAAKIKVNGAYAAVLGVDPSSFRGYAAPSTAASGKAAQEGAAKRDPACVLHKRRSLQLYIARKTRGADYASLSGVDDGGERLG